MLIDAGLYMNKPLIKMQQYCVVMFFHNIDLLMEWIDAEKFQIHHILDVMHKT